MKSLENYSLLETGNVHRRISSENTFARNDPGPGCSKPDKANPGLARILISFCRFSSGSSVYTFCPSVLGVSNLKLHKTSVDNTLIQQKLLPQLTLNSGLALTGFRTTRPGGRFSKAPEPFRVRKANIKFRTLRLQSYFIHIHWKT